jgi:hypothetical protein
LVSGATVSTDYILLEAYAEELQRVLL